MRALLSLVIFCFHAAVAFKFLAFSPQFAVSHVNFIAKIADTLVDAGHEVVIVAPRVDPRIRGALTTKARVIELPENESTKRWNDVQRRVMDGYWNSSVFAYLSEGKEIVRAVTAALNASVHYPGLVEQLRAERFDVAFSEEASGIGLAHMAGVEKTALAISFATFEFSYATSHMPTNPSYVPSLVSWFGDRMTFWQRVVNTLFTVGMGTMMNSGRIDLLRPIFADDIWETMANCSLVFINSEPLLDYPRPTVHRVVEIGGVVLATDNEPINEYWSEVLNRRNRTVILSFGTYIKMSMMPESYKQTIRNALSKFDDVTFIWKYENPEHNVSEGINNVVETTWLPQVALLNDPRLTAFITHGGQGSTLEAAYAGIPMLMVPTQGDQFRNAAMIKRAGLGDILQLSDLEGGDRLESGIRDLLSSDKYFVSASRISAMLRNRPFTAKEKLVRNMEFLVKYGPLRMLDHEGRNLNFFQYYLIDVFLFLGSLTVLVLGLMLTACLACCRLCWRKARGRYASLKQD